MNDALLLFLKAPRPGLAKTRLAPLLGVELAAALSAALLDLALENTRSPAWQRTMCFAPPDAEPELRRRWPDMSWRPQGPGDIGDRMAAAFEDAFAAGADRVALCGTDIPGIDTAHIERAFELLEGQDVVLGPALDGGYWLIALRRARSQLFSGMPWSTPAVLSTTTTRATTLGLSVACAARLADIDDPDALRRAWPTLRSRLSDADLVARLDTALAASTD